MGSVMACGRGRVWGNAIVLIIATMAKTRVLMNMPALGDEEEFIRRGGEMWIRVFELIVELEYFRETAACLGRGSS